MPQIKRFSGFKLLMFFQDENPPHVHIKGPDFAAKTRIADGGLIAGDAPNKVLRQAGKWLRRKSGGLVTTVERIPKLAIWRATSRLSQGPARPEAAFCEFTSPVIRATTRSI